MEALRAVTAVTNADVASLVAEYCPYLFPEPRCCTNSKSSSFPPVSASATVLVRPNAEYNGLEFITASDGQTVLLSYQSEEYIVYLDIIAFERRTSSVFVVLYNDTLLLAVPHSAQIHEVACLPSYDSERTLFAINDHIWCVESNHSCGSVRLEAWDVDFCLDVLCAGTAKPHTHGDEDYIAMPFLARKLKIGLDPSLPYVPLQSACFCVHSSQLPSDLLLLTRPDHKSEAMTPSKQSANDCFQHSTQPSSTTPNQVPDVPQEPTHDLPKPADDLYSLAGRFLSNNPDYFEPDDQPQRLSVLRAQHYPYHIVRVECPRLLSLAAGSALQCPISVVCASFSDLLSSQRAAVRTIVESSLTISWDDLPESWRDTSIECDNITNTNTASVKLGSEPICLYRGCHTPPPTSSPRLLLPLLLTHRLCPSRPFAVVLDVLSGNLVSKFCLSLSESPSGQTEPPQTLTLATVPHPFLSDTLTVCTCAADRVTVWDPEVGTPVCDIPFDTKHERFDSLARWSSFDPAFSTPGMIVLNTAVRNRDQDAIDASGRSQQQAADASRSFITRVFAHQRFRFR